ncbi:DUF3962 domain-containing protein [Coleofasciculus sp. FACHB-712]|uniref:pPIWI_RE module domain-containing protein n=1 Tax=Coleofasciculus sp. FACHB-712 TaxID=2692789 RepID=UPI00168737EA|nr:DUF3962 domain-containing protein [Coleofasciculus sp. FACHB-712]MBD1944385.1 DUF3962 domain-containing protein [Coleofasciculus sp. FACHB-712]
MAYNSIQLFALNVPTQISIPFDLYALEVPEHWKKVFNKLQQRKLGKNYVLPPVKCLNQALQLLIEDVLFPSPDAFQLKPTKWLYSKTDQISTKYIASIVRIWLNVSFENSQCLTDEDIEQIHALTGSDLKFVPVTLPDQVWQVKDGELIIDPLYYHLIPYLFSSAIAAEPLALVDPRTGETFRKVPFQESILDGSSAKEVVSWLPEIEVGERKKKDSKKKEKTIHHYSYLITFALHYHPDGTPYLTCEYGVRRWVSWELGYLKSGVTVCVKPTGSTRFAPCKLKYLGKDKGVDFEGNLARLLRELNFKDQFAAQEVIQSPYKNSEFAWATVYSNRMSKSHNAGAGLFPTDIEIVHQACLKRVQTLLGNGFSPIETYVRCDNTKALTKAGSEYRKVEEFFKLHFAAEPQASPFTIPPNVRLILLAQDTPTEKLIQPLARKYGITDVVVESLGALGAELSGQQWKSECSKRIRDFKNTLSPSPPGTKTIVLIEILPKEQFWQDARKDPKPCFRPALAMLGCVTDHFEPKDEDDTEDFLTTEALQAELERVEAERQTAKEEGKSYKMKSLQSDFARRVETSLVSALAMAGAYVYPTFEAKNFPLDVASVGVYVIPFYTGDNIKYLPVAVRMDKTGVTAKAYGCNDWLDFFDFQVKMASEASAFSPINFNRNEIQNWVFNNLFQETKQPTLYCFDAENLRKRGLLFLQKKHWRKHTLAFCVEQGIEFISTSKYPNVRVACVLTPSTSEVPVYRACNDEGNLEGHTKGVFHPSSQDPNGGYYYLSNQRPDSRSDGILNKSKLISLVATKGENAGGLKKTQPSAQGYNPRGILLSLTLQESDRFSDWASFLQCQRLYGLIQYLGATTLPAPLHLASQLEAYRPIQAIREP